MSYAEFIQGNIRCGLIALNQHATLDRVIFMQFWGSLWIVHAHFCVPRVAPLCLIIVCTVWNDPADIYSFTNASAKFNSYCTVDMYSLYLKRVHCSDT